MMINMCPDSKPLRGYVTAAIVHAIRLPERDRRLDLFHDLDGRQRR